MKRAVIGGEESVLKPSHSPLVLFFHDPGVGEQRPSKVPRAGVRRRRAGESRRGLP